jgi:hypothetical protein
MHDDADYLTLWRKRRQPIGIKEWLRHVLIVPAIPKYPIFVKLKLRISIPLGQWRIKGGNSGHRSVVKLVPGPCKRVLYVPGNALDSSVRAFKTRMTILFCGKSRFYFYKLNDCKNIKLLFINKNLILAYG